MKTFSNKIQILGEKFQETKDEKDFNSLYKLTYNYYRLTCLKYYTQDINHVNDILNTFHFNIFKSIDQYDKNRGKFHSWIGMIFQNEAINNFKHYKHERKVFYVENIYDKLFNNQEYEEEFEFIKKEDVIDYLYDLSLKEINNLDEPYRTVMYERQIRKKMIHVIALELGWNLNTTKTRLTKARLDLGINMREKYPELVEAYNPKFTST